MFGVKPCRQRRKVCGVGLVMLRLFAAPKKQQEAAEMAQIWYFAWGIASLPQPLL